MVGMYAGVWYGLQIDYFLVQETERLDSNVLLCMHLQRFENMFAELDGPCV